MFMARFIVGFNVGIFVGTGAGGAEGRFIFMALFIVGMFIMAMERLIVGGDVGTTVGLKVGKPVGSTVGTMVGPTVGMIFEDFILFGDMELFADNFDIIDMEDILDIPFFVFILLLLDFLLIPILRERISDMEDAAGVTQRRVVIAVKIKDVFIVSLYSVCVARANKDWTDL